MQIDPQTTKLIPLPSPAEYSFFRALPEHIEMLWSGIEIELDKEPELWNFGQTKESIRILLLQGAFQMWFVTQHSLVAGLFMTHMNIYPAMKVLEIVWAQGRDLEAYMGIGLSALEEFALANGFNAVSVCGRIGWRKPLLPFGYTHMHSVFTKSLDRRGYH